MNSLIKGLVIILIIGGSSAGVFNPISSKEQQIVEKTEELPSKVSSFVDEASIKISDFQNSLHYGTQDVIEGNQNSEGVATILSLVSGILPKDEQLYLESAIQEIISKNFDLHDILSWLNDAVQDFFNLVMEITSEVNITEYLNALAANTTGDGELDVKGQGVATILSLVSGILPKDEQLYLESTIQEIISENFDLHDILSFPNDAVQDFFNLVMKIIREVNITEYLNALATNTTEDGELDFKGQGVATILNLVSGILPKNEQLYLESTIQEIISENFELHDILSLLNDAVQDLYNFVMKIISEINITEYLNALLATKTTEDGQLDFKGLAEKYIKTAEEYHVTTEDGYILTLFRIRGDGDVVVLSHGLLSSSDDFIILGNSSLIYMLVQKGYDVWVMNYRGNRYSRSHEKLNPDIDEKFWDYSMHEFGNYDLKAVIDTVLEETEKEQLSVIGHSEGNAAVFVLTSMRPEYNEKIKVFVALSPICYVSNPGFAFHTLVSWGPILDEVLQAIGVEEILGFESFTRNLIQLVCSQDALGYNACVNLGLGALFGHHPENLEPDDFQRVLGHFPAGSSRKNFNHYFQIGESGNFAQYDYGDGNKDKYGCETPPKYDFRRVTCKVVLFAGGIDNILGIEDAERVRDQVPNLGLYYVLEEYNHADFLWGKDAAEVLYPKVLAQLKTFPKPLRPSVDIPQDVGGRHCCLGGSF